MFARSAQPALVAAIIVAYLGYVFQIWREDVWHSGLGDFGDPNFINFILEHWVQSVHHLSNPASPPMYFPTRGTLGYSHGLILYAPLYAVARLFVHPFHAHTATIFTVLACGAAGLYALMRRTVGLSFLEAIVLTMFFVTSRNVVNAGMSIWSQTASVFLIPPILLLAVLAAQHPRRRSQVVLAFSAGALAALMFTQDVYTAQFALFFVVAGAAIASVAVSEPPLHRRVANVWSNERRVDVRIAAIILAMLVIWALAIVITGGGAFQVGSVRIASRDWRRPAALAVAAAALIVYRRRQIHHREHTEHSEKYRSLWPLHSLWSVVHPRPADTPGWTVPFASGALLGLLVFAWIYLPAYREFPGFPVEQMMESVRALDWARWPTWNVIRALAVYPSVRSFYFVLLVAVAASVPAMTVERRLRLAALGFLLLSLVVLLIPIRFGDVSIWKTFFLPFVGFSAIRDPMRVVQVYELVVVLAAAVFLAHLPRVSWLRTAVVALAITLMIVDWNREVFVFERPIAEYDRWIDSPVVSDPGCRSFFIKGASPAYMARWNNRWILYGVDSMFVAWRYSIPTLNGYSAWFPPGWGLANPQEQGYDAAVQSWVQRHHLRDVCEFDIEARTFKLQKW